MDSYTLKKNFIVILIIEVKVCISSQAVKLRVPELFVLNTGKKPCLGSLIYINYNVASP